jgi:NADPH:quinone reductase-like Zn-dependent oxidoreductase
MKAFQLLAHGAPGTFALRDVPDPSPQPGQVVVQVQACGLNHLDLWTEQGVLPVPIALPRTQGCEIAGGVLEVGEGVAGWQPGDRVAVQSNLFCGECDPCRRGEESFCTHNVMLGVQRDGGFAEKVLVPERALVRLPDAVDFETSAALSLAGSTAMHMLTNRARVKEGDWVLVVGGASGVGSAGIQIAKHLGGRVISTGSTETKRRLALQLGAEFVLDPAQRDWPVEARRLTGKRGVDLVLEHVGGDRLGDVFKCLAWGGTVVTCGATAGRNVALDLWPLFVKQQRLIGSYGRDRKDLDATLEGAASGWLKPVIDSTYPLTEVDLAFKRLRARAVLGKIVIEPFEPVAESD